MTRKTSKVGGKIYAYYMCSNYKKHKRCSSHRIREDKLESMIFETLKEMSALLVDADEALKAIGERGNYQIDKRKLEERIQKNNDDIAHWNQLKVSTYEDYRDGIIDKDDFILLKDSFEEKKKNALIAIAQLEEEAKKTERNKENDRLWIEEYRKVKSLPSLTRDILVNLVSEVKILENKDIEIVLDDNDEYQYLIKMASEVISDPEKKDELERMVG